MAQDDLEIKGKVDLSDGDKALKKQERQVNRLTRSYEALGKKIGALPSPLLINASMSKKPRITQRAVATYPVRQAQAPRITPSVSKTIVYDVGPISNNTGRSKTRPSRIEPDIIENKPKKKSKPKATKTSNATTESTLLNAKASYKKEVNKSEQLVQRKNERPDRQEALREKRERNKNVSKKNENDHIINTGKLNAALNKLTSSVLISANALAQSKVMADAKTGTENIKAQNRLDTIEATKNRKLAEISRRGLVESGKMTLADNLGKEERNRKLEQKDIQLSNAARKIESNEMIQKARTGLAMERLKAGANSAAMELEKVKLQSKHKPAIERIKAQNKLDLAEMSKDKSLSEIGRRGLVNSGLSAQRANEKSRAGREDLANKMAGIEDATNQALRKSLGIKKIERDHRDDRDKRAEKQREKLMRDSEKRAATISARTYNDRQAFLTRENNKRSILDRRSLQEARPELFEGRFDPRNGGPTGMKARRFFGGGGRGGMGRSSLEGVGFAAFGGALALKGLVEPSGDLEQNIIKTIAAQGNGLDKAFRDKEFAKIRDSVRNNTDLSPITETEYSQALLAIAKDGLAVSKSFRVNENEIRKLNAADVLASTERVRIKLKQEGRLSDSVNNKLSKIGDRGSFDSSDFQLGATRQANLIALALGEPEKIGIIADALGDFLPKVVANTNQLDEVITQFSTDSIAKAFTASTLSSRFTIEQTVSTLRNLQGVAQRTSLGIDELLILNASLDRIGPSGVRVGTSIRRTVEELSSPSAADAKLLNATQGVTGFNSTSLPKAIKNAKSGVELADIIVQMATGINKLKGDDGIAARTFFQRLVGTEAIKGITGILEESFKANIEEIRKKAQNFDLTGNIDFQKSAFNLRARTFTKEFSSLFQTLVIDGGILKTTGDLLFGFAEKFSHLKTTLANDQSLNKFIATIIKAAVMTAALGVALVGILTVSSLLTAFGGIPLIVASVTSLAIAFNDLSDNGIVKLAGSIRDFMEEIGLINPKLDEKQQQNFNLLQSKALDMQLTDRDIDRKSKEAGAVLTFNKSNQAFNETFGTDLFGKALSTYGTLALVGADIKDFFGLDKSAQKTRSEILGGAGGISDQRLAESQSDEIMTEFQTIYTQALELQRVENEAKITEIDIMVELNKLREKQLVQEQDFYDLRQTTLNNAALGLQ